MSGLVATAPGKLMLAGEYAVLMRGPAVLIAVSRRVTARVDASASRVRESPFLQAVVDRLAARFGPDDASVEAARAIAVESTAFQDTRGQKLGLGSSAAVTVAAVARAIAARTSDRDAIQLLDRDLIHEVARMAHAAAQSTLGAAGSGADVAACTYGGAIRFEASGAVVPRTVPPSVTLIPFFTGAPASTARLVDQIKERERFAVTDSVLIDAMHGLMQAGQAVDDAFVQALPSAGVVAAFDQAADAMDALNRWSHTELVPACVTAARDALRTLGGTAKTTGAGGGDTAIAVIPATADVTDARRRLIECSCLPLDLTVDETGVDLRPMAQ